MPGVPLTCATFEPKHRSRRAGPNLGARGVSPPERHWFSEPWAGQEGRGQTWEPEGFPPREALVFRAVGLTSLLTAALRGEASELALNTELWSSSSVDGGDGPESTGCALGLGLSRRGGGSSSSWEAGPF